MSALSAGHIVILFFAIVISTDVVYAVETAVPEICNGRIEATHGGAVINILWTGCNSPDCETNFWVTFRSDGFLSTVSHGMYGYHPYVAPDKTWQVECFYDYSDDGGRTTPCKYQGSVFKKTVMSLKKYKTISVTLSTCINKTCSGIKKYNFVNPARNPCYFSNPCKNNAKCIPGADTYNCTCTPEWAGKNCEVLMPQGYNYTAGKCLDYDAKIQEIFVSSAKECGSLCAAMNDSKTPCKSFEIKNVPSSNQKKCTLRDSNSLTHRLVTCDGDFFEASAPNNQPKPTRPTIRSKSTCNSAGTFYLLLLIMMSLGLI